MGHALNKTPNSYVWKSVYALIMEMMNSCSVPALQVPRIQLSYTIFYSPIVLEMLAHGNITENLVFMEA